MADFGLKFVTGKFVQLEQKHWFKLLKEKRGIKELILCNPNLRLFHVDIQLPGLRPFEETIIQF